MLCASMIVLRQPEIYDRSGDNLPGSKILRGHAGHVSLVGDSFCRALAVSTLELDLIVTSSRNSRLATGAASLVGSCKRFAA